MLSWIRENELDLSASKAILINRFHQNDTNALFSLLKTFNSIVNNKWPVFDWKQIQIKEILYVLKKQWVLMSMLK